MEVSHTRQYPCLIRILSGRNQTFLNNLNKLSSTFNFRKAATAPTLTGATKVEIVPATTVFAGGSDGAPRN